MEAEQKRHDELKRQAEAAKEAERAAKYELALAREEERKMVRDTHSTSAHQRTVALLSSFPGSSSTVMQACCSIWCGKCLT